MPLREKCWLPTETLILVKYWQWNYEIFIIGAMLKQCWGNILCQIYQYCFVTRNFFFNTLSNTSHQEIINLSISNVLDRVNINEIKIKFVEKSFGEMTRFLFQSII